MRYTEMDNLCFMVDSFYFVNTLVIPDKMNRYDIALWKSQNVHSGLHLYAQATGLRQHIFA